MSFLPTKTKTGMFNDFKFSQMLKPAEAAVEAAEAAATRYAAARHAAAAAEAKG